MNEGGTYSDSILEPITCPLKGNYSVDSLKVRIPITRVRILDESIRGIVSKVVEADGSGYQGRQFYDMDGTLYNVIEEKQNTKASRDEYGIKTTFSIEKRATQFDTIEYLVILVNAKQLKQQYFEGIHVGNISNLHQYLISLGVVQFSLKELLKAECTDIDFKKDFEATDEDMKEAFDLMEKNSIPSSHIDVGVLPFWQNDNKGLQFNKRTTTKIKTAPFLKIYSKTLDLLHKSNIFALAHFKEIPQNLWRMEFTIKNKKHLASFGHGNTLSDILSLSNEHIEEMGANSLRAVLQERVRDSKLNDQSIPPKDVVLINALIFMLDKGLQWSIIKKMLTGNMTRQNQSKKNQQLDSLFNSYIRPIEHYSSALNVDSILNQIGYNF